MRSPAYPHIQDGHTAIHAASQEGHFEVVKKLLDAEADVNVTADVSKSALVYCYPV